MAGRRGWSCGANCFGLLRLGFEFAGLVTTISSICAACESWFATILSVDATDSDADFGVGCGLEDVDNSFFAELKDGKKRDNHAVFSFASGK